jgi:hypothetical protein
MTAAALAVWLPEPNATHLRETNTMRQWFWLTAATLVLLPAACSTTSAVAGPPVTSVGAENSAGAIRAAEEVGAAHSPQAAFHLQLAKEQFEHARRLTSPSDLPAAKRLLQRAEADADLALALARENTDKVEAQAALDKANMLNDSVAQ